MSSTTQFRCDGCHKSIDRADWSEMIHGRAFGAALHFHDEECRKAFESAVHLRTERWVGSALGLPDVGNSGLPMRLRARTVTDEAFDGLTAEDIRRIRGGAEASRIPGTEGLATILTPIPAGPDPGLSEKKPNRKRGRRA